MKNVRNEFDDQIFLNNLCVVVMIAFIEPGKTIVLNFNHVHYDDGVEIFASRVSCSRL